MTSSLGAIHRASLVLTSAAGAIVFMSGCATQAPPVAVADMPASAQVQKAAQEAVAKAAPAQPQLKRKIAIGRISNETSYGKSLLRDNHGDPVGKQVSDMLAKALTESGAYVVLERSDIGRIEAERALTGSASKLVGVDALILGSLTEFGRKTVGQTGFVSSSKKQVAFAKIDLRLVDVSTGQSFFAASGAGESSTESASTFGFGSQAAYDATLNDSSIRQAVADVVNRLTTELSSRPWQTYLLAAEQGAYYVAGGKTQGLQPGMLFSVQSAGRKVKSPQTGFEITLPGAEVAQIRIESLFGDTETSEGAVARLVSGAIDAGALDKLVVRQKGMQ